MAVRRGLVFALILGAVCLGRCPATSQVAIGDEPAAAPLTLEQLSTGKLRIVDLSHSLNDQNAYWPAPGYEPFHLRTIATLEKNGVLSKAFATPEHLGTHLDAPNHFEPNQPAVDQIQPADLFAPGIVIDVSMQDSGNVDYTLAVADIKRWEEEHGRIPDGAVVMLNTGWGQHWKNFARYKNQDVMGKLHFPGYGAEAVTWLIQKRRVKGIGIDTLSIDHGISKDFIVHHLINKAGKYGLENVAQLDQLPARGFYVTVAPIKIETGSGGPTRIFAILGKQGT